jgi:hypothetical protein
MFFDFLKKLFNRGGRPLRHDPPWKGDPVAAIIHWTPVKKGGTTFGTHKLVETDLSRLEFRPTFIAWLLGGFLLLAGMGIIAVGISMGVNEREQWFFLFPIVFGLVFGGIGGWMIYTYSSPIVFDKRMGCFWKGRKSPNEVYDRKPLKYYAKLGDIHALQIISEYCKGSKNRRYYSYELNLVLSDGLRINVVDHGNLDKLRSDTQTLSRFLGKPVWDLTAQ